MSDVAKDADRDLHCPGCGQSGAFDFHGQFTEKTTVTTHADPETLMDYRVLTVWSEIHCPECGEFFRVQDSDTMNEIEGSEQKVAEVL